MLSVADRDTHYLRLVEVQTLLMLLSAAQDVCGDAEVTSKLRPKIRKRLNVLLRGIFSLNNEKEEDLPPEP